MFMRKVTCITFVLLIVVLGLLWEIKHVQNVQVVQDFASEKKIENSRLKITFFDVGQGDAGFIQFPDNEKMLVDCGPDARILEALGRVLPYYDRDIDYLVVTHPDLDHYGGCIDVLTRYNVKNIFYNGMKKPGDNAWQWFWDLVQKEGADYHEVSVEEAWNIASTTVDFLYPNKPVSELIKTDLYKNYNGNNMSIIMALRYDNHQVLFTGDAESGLEKYLTDAYGDKLKSDILKVGHHGSSNSSSKDFLAVVKPAYAVISVGKENTFGHPTERVLKKLERAVAKILRTDELGDITCEAETEVVCAKKN